MAKLDPGGKGLLYTQTRNLENNSNEKNLKTAPQASPRKAGSMGLWGGPRALYL